MQSRTESTHKLRYLRTDNIMPYLKLKAPEHRIVKECPALSYDVLPQIRCRVGTDYLIYCVLYHAYGKSCRDVLHGCSVLLRLLDGRVHKNCAARAEIDGRFCEKTELCKVLDIMSHRVREGFYKRAAARGACFVKHDAVNSIASYLKALYILTTDVENKINFRIKMPCCVKMRHGLYYAGVYMKSMLYQFLAVACNRTSHDFDFITAYII